MLLINIDKKLNKLGFNKVEETDLFVSYERYEPKYHFTHKVDLCHKQYIPNMIQSYDAFDEHFCGLSAKEAKLFSAKVAQKWGR